jgi:Ran-binding protein 3
LTGEEEDETIYSVRGKLFILSEQNQWKERGTGLLRLNRRRVDHSGARLGRFYFNDGSVLGI